MKKMGLLLFLGVMFLVMLFVPDARAQREIIAWMKVPIGELPPIGRYKIRYYGKKDAKGQDTTLKMWKQDAVAAYPLINDVNQDLAAAVFYDQRHLNTDAILPERNVVLPENLYNLLAGGLYRRQFDNDWIAGLSLLVGSTSDKLFNSEKEMTVHTNVYTKIPASAENSWLFYIDVDNNRSFMHTVPVVPGAAYWYKPSDQFEAILGLPATYLDINLTEKWEFELLYILTTDVHAKMSYDITKKIEAYCKFDWNSEVFARAGRETRRDKLCYYEKALSAGLHWQVMKYAGLDLAGGYAFDRFFYEAKSYDKRGTDRVNFKDGPFVEVHVGIPF